MDINQREKLENEREEIICNSYVEKIMPPERADVGEFERDIDFISDENISERNSLKPNLRNTIFLGKNKKNGKFYYYFKTTENFLTRFILNEEAFKVFNARTEEKSLDERRLKLTSTLIVLYYREMIKYYQEKTANLSIEKLYDNFDEESLEKVENIIKELTIFFTKVYYRHPLYEQKEVSEYLEYLMEKYNITDQIAEMEKTLNLIRDIGIYQLARKEEKKKEIEEKKREKWNIIFAIIGIVIALGEVFLALTELLSR